MQTRSKTSIASTVVVRSFNPEPRSLILIPEKNLDDVAYAESSRKRFTPNYCDKLRNHKKIYDVDIDFDEASKAWLQNKKKLGNGCYSYSISNFGVKS